MAVTHTQDQEPVQTFADWYVNYSVDERTGCLDRLALGPQASRLWREYEYFKREMDARVGNYGVLEKLADGEVIKEQPDLPNVSSGETAGLIRRIARNLVQNTPNVEVISKFDDDSVPGIFSKHILTSQIIGSDHYSNDMQQNLFASTKTALTLGFSCVVPVLQQDAAGGWFMKYDPIHYRDVFPDPGCRDVRQATSVFVRRYLTAGEVRQLLRDNAAGWDQAALRTLLKNPAPPRDRQSVDLQTAKRGLIPAGYEVITWYSSTGEPFLTFCGVSKMLLRVEKNKHPLKQHPVHFLVLEKDDQQPLGKSQVELLVGRQDFQDLMLNGAMKLWYRNINPSIIGYGVVNSVPNLGPGKYTQISNPNARLEPFEVNTQTLLQYGAISQQNLGSMVNLIGSADQQMATQAGHGMSATPQGVEAQEAMVDVTTNNYQKAIEAFFSRYCSYALTIFFQELKSVRQVTPSADARQKLLHAGLGPESFGEDGSLEIDFGDMAEEYFVRCVPGSLVELEDEKQLRILNELFVPLSQAMPALAAAQNQQLLEQASRAMQYIIMKQIELSGSTTARDLAALVGGKDLDIDGALARDSRIKALEDLISGADGGSEAEQELTHQAISQLQEQVAMLIEHNEVLQQKLGVTNEASAPAEGDSEPATSLPA